MFIASIYLLYDHLLRGDLSTTTCLMGDLLSWTTPIEWASYWSFLALISYTLALRSSLILIASLACTNWSSSLVSSSFCTVITLIWLLSESISTWRLELLSNRAELLYLAPSSSFLMYIIWSSLALILDSRSLILVVNSIFLELSVSILFYKSTFSFLYFSSSAFKWFNSF